MNKVINKIIAERKRQDEKWGSDRMLADYEWLTILVEEVGEVAKAMLEGSPTVNEELVQVAAVAVAWLECMQRRAKEKIYVSRTTKSNV
jgi:NTP pyrophosphatase (non-canonical NTP hydrolase)